VYYHTDVAGSVRMVTDESGAAIEQYNYTPFGALVGGQAPGVAQPRGYAGKERDVETGNDYFGARYFASQIGRFTTVDQVLDIERALAEPQLWNRYAYVTNNPLKFVDPDGRQREAALDRDVYALLNKQITVDEYNARIQARGAGAAIGALVAAGPVIWRVAVSCFLSPSCQSHAVDLLEGAAGGPARVTPTGDIDPAAEALAARLGGKASATIEGFGRREFDTVSEKFVAQTFSGASALLKPDNFLNARRRAQIRATLEAAKATGRKALFEFEDGAHDDVVAFIERNAERIGAQYEVVKKP
jgi:RHS repeat-associated protein